MMVRLEGGWALPRGCHWVLRNRKIEGSPHVGSMYKKDGR